jgi:hypothetical protein
VWWLDSPGEQDKTPAAAVYNRGATLLPVAADTLDSVRGRGSTLSEVSVARTAVERYYERLHSEKNVGKQEYADWVDDARGDELGDLSLIDQRLSYDVVVFRNESRTVRTCLQDALNGCNYDEADRILTDLRAKQISIPVYRQDSREAIELEKLPPLHPTMETRYVDPSMVEYTDFFDQETGFSVPDPDISRRFL